MSIDVYTALFLKALPSFVNRKTTTSSDFLWPVPIIYPMKTEWFPIEIEIDIPYGQICYLYLTGLSQRRHYGIH